MVTVGLFATAGYTEVGGLQRFLEQALPGASIRRQLPAARKQKKRLRGAPAALRTAPADLPGLTGRALIEEMLARLKRYPTSHLDGILVVDDADCRFCEDHRNGISELKTQVEAAVHQAIGRELPVFVLLASPEIEAWFLEDLARTFASRAYKQSHWNTALSAQELTLHLAASGVARPAFGWETFGCPEKNGACTTKLSDSMSAAFSEHADEIRAYSKRRDGPNLLRALDADVLERRAEIYFAPTMVRLRAWVTRGAGHNSAGSR